MNDGPLISYCTRCFGMLFLAILFSACVIEERWRSSTSCQPNQLFPIGTAHQQQLQTQGSLFACFQVQWLDDTGKITAQSQLVRLDKQGTLSGFQRSSQTWNDSPNIPVTSQQKQQKHRFRLYFPPATASQDSYAAHCHNQVQQATYDCAANPNQCTMFLTLTPRTPSTTFSFQEGQNHCKMVRFSSPNPNELPPFHREEAPKPTEPPPPPERKPESLPPHETSIPDQDPPEITPEKPLPELGACPPNKQMCPGIGCINLTSNPQHCGMCKNPCLDGKSCIQGQCVTQSISLTSTRMMNNATIRFFKNEMIIVGGYTDALSFNGKLIIPTSKSAPPGTTYLFVLRLDNNYQVLSKKFFFVDAPNIQDVQVDRKGNLYIAGGFQNNAKFGNIELNRAGGSSVRPFYLKLDPQGNVIHANQIQTGGGGIINSITLGSDQRYYHIAGRFKGNFLQGKNIALSNKQTTAFFATILDAKTSKPRQKPGDIIKAISFGNASSGRSEVKCLFPTAKGFLLLGEFQNTLHFQTHTLFNTKGFSLFALELSANGIQVIQTLQTTGKTNSDTHRIHACHKDKQGRISVVGEALGFLQIENKSYTISKPSGFLLTILPAGLSKFAFGPPPRFQRSVSSAKALDVTTHPQKNTLHITGEFHKKLTEPPVASNGSDNFQLFSIQYNSDSSPIKNKTQTLASPDPKASLAGYSLAFSSTHQLHILGTYNRSFSVWNRTFTLPSNNSLGIFIIRAPWPQ